ncbi:unnamed protein product, partial [Staurois parvus]
MSEQYRYPPNDPFLQSIQSDVLHKRHGEFFEVIFFFVIIFRKMKNIFFYILSP